MHKRRAREKFSDLAVAIGIGELEQAVETGVKGDVPQWLFEAAMRDELTEHQYQELVATCDEHPVLWESFIEHKKSFGAGSEWSDSFAKFVVAKNNRVAYEKARRISQEPLKPAPPYLICGRAGCGKTHLLRAIAKDLRSENPDVPVFLGSAGELAGSEGPQKDIGSGRGVWLIDDAQSADPKSGFVAKVASLVESGNRVVLAADRSLYDLAKGGLKFSPELLKATDVIDIGPPDEETSRAILVGMAKAENLSLDESAVDYLVELAQGNMTVMQAYIDELALLPPKPMGLEDVRSALGEAHGIDSKPTPGEDIV